MSKRDLKLFQQVPIGGLFFRTPDIGDLPSIKTEDGRARTPRGELVEVHPHVLVFTIAVIEEVPTWMIEPVYFEEKGIV